MSGGFGCYAIRHSGITKRIRRYPYMCIVIPSSLCIIIERHSKRKCENIFRSLFMYWLRFCVCIFVLCVFCAFFERRKENNSSWKMCVTILNSKVRTEWGIERLIQLMHTRSNKSKCTSDCIRVTLEWCVCFFFRVYPLVRAWASESVVNSFGHKKRFVWELLYLVGKIHSQFYYDYAPSCMPHVSILAFTLYRFALSHSLYTRYSSLTHSASLSLSGSGCAMQFFAVNEVVYIVRLRTPFLHPKSIAIWVWFALSCCYCHRCRRRHRHHRWPFDRI